MSKNNYSEYRKTATVKAKLFEEGDQDGFIHNKIVDESDENINTILVPYISTLENQFHQGEFGKHYVCIGINGERWLVEKEIFEKTYEKV